MDIIFHSMTGNVRRFLEKVQLPHRSMDHINDVDHPFVFVTNTVGFGQAPEQVMRFLEKYRSRLYAVAASGNRNWGSNFAHAADEISRAYHVPILMKFELNGTDEEVRQFKERMRQYDRDSGCRV
ncbi:class Ib ribonucleoside-diphosphate reductase assembly flavoprotein NrdI [Sporolactobacillus vineae]|uniref:class Ib ribonucleoside-diphosphate reductase assembly flavoprotein NrdI n=1 Tax=Sporolactobacillus vineae TaxID=444463 RepID=UPI0002883ACE|nr:class Ib ribonucleoside-diphosphate reductase assembly flavoprotein NrdI [Sporolactobacillus vineae]